MTKDGRDAASDRARSLRVHLLGAREDNLRPVLIFERLAGDPVGDLDELAGQGFVANEIGVSCDVREVRQAERQLGDERDAADLLDHALAPEFFAEQDRVDLGAALAQGDHGAEDELMGADVEVVGAQQLDGLVDECVVEDDGAEDGALGIGVVRQRAFKQLLAGWRWR